MSIEDFERELKEGKGKSIINTVIKMLKGNKENVEKFIDDFIKELRKEYRQGK
jgi:hypothetical protein